MASFFFPLLKLSAFNLFIQLFLVFSGDAQITIDVECIEAFLKDVSDPFESTSLKLPDHENDYKK